MGDGNSRRYPTERYVRFGCPSRDRLNFIWGKLI